MQTRLLLVDDQEDNRIVYRTVLEHAGYAVREASDGREALEQVRRERPDLILMDLAMPVMDGMTATHRIRKDPVTRDIPVLAITARDLSDLRALREAGFCGFVRKPCLPQAVLGAVRRCLEAWARGESWVDLRDLDVPYLPRP